MPIYEYRCIENGHEFEVIHGVTEKPPEKCQQCSSRVEKLVSRSSFHLKGSGWYTTDYKKAPAKKEATQESAKPDKKDSKESTKKSESPKNEK